MCLTIQFCLPSLGNEISRQPGCRLAYHSGSAAQDVLRVQYTRELRDAVFAMWYNDYGESILA